MKKEISIVLCFCCMLILCSCNNSVKINVSTIDVDYMNKSQTTIDGIAVDLESAGLYSIYLKDSLFVVQVALNDHYLDLYRYPSFEHITNICTKGRARNEFTNDPQNPADQLYYSGDDIIIPLVDSESHIREINLSKSIEDGVAKLESYNDCMDFNFGRCVVLNEGPAYLFYNQFCEYNEFNLKKSKAPQYEYLVDGKVEKKIKVFPSLCRVDEPAAIDGAYSGSLRKHPHKNVIIQPMQYMDYIFFFDLENDKNFAIHQTGSSTYNDNVIALSDELHFTDAKTTDDCFMVLYWNGKQNVGLQSKSQRRPELMVFNWSGDFLGSAILGERVVDIEYDDVNKVLIGKHADNDKVYCFDLKSFMGSIGL